MGYLSRTWQCTRKSVDDPCDNLKLEREDVGEVAIEAVAPKMGVVCDVDELRIDAHTVRSASDTSLDEIAYAEFPRHLAGID